MNSIFTASFIRYLNSLVVVFHLNLIRRHIYSIMNCNWFEWRKYVKEKLTVFFLYDLGFVQPALIGNSHFKIEPIFLYRNSIRFDFSFRTFQSFTLRRSILCFLMRWRHFASFSISLHRLNGILSSVSFAAPKRWLTLWWERE